MRVSEDALRSAAFLFLLRVRRNETIPIVPVSYRRRPASLTASHSYFAFITPLPLPEEERREKLYTHEALASDTLIRGLSRSSFRRILCSVSRLSLSSDMLCLCGRAFILSCACLDQGILWGRCFRCPDDLDRTGLLLDFQTADTASLLMPLCSCQVPFRMVVQSRATRMERIRASCRCSLERA
mgnify:CR=1 FL=1